MAKEKKISVNIYLNKKLKPYLTNGDQEYPIYIRVSYNGKNTQFAPNWDIWFYGFELYKIYENHAKEHGYVSENKFESIKKHFISNDFPEHSSNNIDSDIYKLSYQLRKKKQEIIDIINFEKKYDFGLTGFGIRFNAYHAKISTVLNSFLSDNIIDDLGRELSNSGKKFLLKDQFFTYKYEYLEEHELIQNLSPHLIRKIGLFFNWYVFEQTHFYIDTKFFLGKHEESKRLLNEFLFDTYEELQHISSTDLFSKFFLEGKFKKEYFEIINYFDAVKELDKYVFKRLILFTLSSANKNVKI